MQHITKTDLKQEMKEGIKCMGENYEYASAAKTLNKTDKEHISLSTHNHLTSHQMLKSFTNQLLIDNVLNPFIKPHLF